MRVFRWNVLLLVLFSAMASVAADKAIVTSMKKVKCGARIAKFSVVETLVGPDMITPELSCLEFTLRTPRVQYRLRPARQMLLPVGTTVNVRVDKKHVMVQIEDTKEVRCEVVSMDLLDDNGQPIEPREIEGIPVTAMSSPYVAQRTATRALPPTPNRNCLTMEGDVVSCDSKETGASTGVAR
jgi:hypothetical protein